MITETVSHMLFTCASTKAPSRKWEVFLIRFQAFFPHSLPGHIRQASRENRPHGLCRCHTKTILLLVWHWLFRIWLCWHHRLYSRKVGVIPKEGWAQPHVPIRLLVWQRQGPWGLFSRDAHHKDKLSRVLNLDFKAVDLSCSFVKNISNLL